MRRAVFLDRDGVLNRLVYRPAEGIFDSPYALEEFALLPESGRAVRLIHELGLLAVVISNQPGVAKGKCDLTRLHVLTAELETRLAGEGATLDAVYYCLHHPDGCVAALRLACDCRKPRPGLLQQAARELDIDLSASYMVGDSARDIEAGLAAGCATVRVGDAATAATDAAPAQFVARSLIEAVQQIAQKEA